MKILVMNAGRLASVEGGAVRFRNLAFKGNEIIWVDPITSKDYYKTEDLDKKIPSNVRLIGGGYCASNPLTELIAREKHFLKAVKENECDVAVFYNAWGTFLARRYLRKKGVQVVFDYIDLMHGFRSGLQKQVARRSTVQALKESDCVITTAHRLYEDARKFNKRVFLVPNGVDEKFFRNVKPKKIRHPAVGFVGGFGPWVDFGKIIGVARTNRQINFYFIGDGVQAKELKKNAKAMKNVFVSDGFVPQAEAREWMAAFDACVIPFHRSELTDAVCPLKLFEYWALKKAVIATPTYELKKIIGDGEAVFADTGKEWEQAIARLAADKNLRKRLGENGARKAREYYWGSLAKKYLAILRALVR